MSTDKKGTKILAKSLFKELRGNGYSANQILSLSTELIDLVTQDLRDEHAQAAAGGDIQRQFVAAEHAAHVQRRAAAPSGISPGRAVTAY